MTKAPAKSATAARPRLTRRQLADRIHDQTGARAGKIELFFADCERAAAQINLKTGTSRRIRVNMDCHDVLDAVMPDMTPAGDGTVHAATDAHFLPEGWTFQHDRSGFCTLQAVKRR